MGGQGDGLHKYHDLPKCTVRRVEHRPGQGFWDLPLSTGADGPGGLTPPATSRLASYYYVVLPPMV